MALVYHSSGVIRKLVKYVEKYYPNTLLTTRPRGSPGGAYGDRERYGQPDIIIPELRCRYVGLAIWVKSEMTEAKRGFLKVLRRSSYETIVSDDFDDLRICFDRYMAKCDVSCNEAVTYHSNGVIRKFVRYVEKYYPDVLLIVRPEDTIVNRELGYRSGQPDILIPEQKCMYMGLAIWAKSEMLKYETGFLRRLSRQSCETVVSDDFDDLRLCFEMYMAKCDDRYRVDNHQLKNIKRLNRDKVTRPLPSGYGFIDEVTREYPPCTSTYFFVLRYVVRHVKSKYPSAVLIPGLGVDGQPDLMIISTNIIHNGLAVWVSNTELCYRFTEMSDNQLDFLKRMALRSYVTIASSYRVSLTKFIDEYMRGEYEYGQVLPTYKYDNS